MRNSALIVGITSCLWAGSAFGQNQPGLIVPGKSAWHIRIGSVLPTRLRGQKPWAELVVQSNWVSVYSASKGQGQAPSVEAIRIVAPNWKLSNGISTATPVGKIRQNYPALKLAVTYNNPYYGQVAIFEDSAKGIAFDFSASKTASGSRKCLVITVFQPRTLIRALLADPTLKTTLRPRAGA